MKNILFDNTEKSLKNNKEKINKINEEEDKNSISYLLEGDEYNRLRDSYSQFYWDYKQIKR